MSVNEEKKKSLEQWLDDMLEAHKHMCRNENFVYDEMLTGISKSVFPRIISVCGVVEIAETLGCCISFEPFCLGTRGIVKYKGVELIETFYN